MVIAGCVSIMFHLIVFAIKKPENTPQDKHLKAPLAVVLVNSQSQVSPVAPKRLAQHDLNGGGQEESPERASTISPMVPGLTEKLNQLQEARKMSNDFYEQSQLDARVQKIREQMTQERRMLERFKAG